MLYGTPSKTPSKQYAIHTWNGCCGSWMLQCTTTKKAAARKVYNLMKKRGSPVQMTVTLLLVVAA